MTSNTTPEGEASASNAYTNWDAYKAFNGDKTNGGWSTYGNGAPQWLKYAFNLSVIVKKAKVYPIYSTYGDSIQCKDYKIQGSNDNFVNDTHDIYSGTVANNKSIYTVQNSQSGTEYCSVDGETCILSNNSTYTSCRLYISTSYANNACCVSLVQFYGRTIGGVQTWLRSAGITNKTYTTLAEVLADSTTLSALMADHNAVDYLVTAKAWASTICADSTAMSYIGLNNYASDTLLADETWNVAINNSTYKTSVLTVQNPYMTSNTAPSGECFGSSLNSATYQYYHPFMSSPASWLPNSSDSTPYIGYEFTSALKIATAKVNITVEGSPTTVRLVVQGYDSNNQWVDVSNSMTMSAGTFNITCDLATVSKVRLSMDGRINDGLSNLYRINSIQFLGRTDV
jgi:hypothetical protein